LSLDDRKAVDYPGRDDADLINILSAIDGAIIAMIFVQQSKGRVKISWRICGNDRPELDVSQIAMQFGGGGHKAASGAELNGTMEEVEESIVNATRVLLKKYNRYG
jgi:phosphoesterase RecJ-like protein